MCYKPVYGFKCNKCLECRKPRASVWALRCGMESELHTMSCFITLTYADLHPKTGEPAPYHLRKKDLQDFKKRLRKHLNYHYKIKIKTFDCGEYGDRNFRPHFHMLIFGYDFPKKWKARDSDRGHAIYDCQELEDLWGFGLTTIQDLTTNAAAYCALYAAKPTHELPKHLRPYPEFNTMSKNLGIEPMLAKMETYLETDEVYFDGRKQPIPQAVLNKYFTKEQRRLGHFADCLCKNIFRLMARCDYIRHKQYHHLKQRRVDKALENEKSNIAKLATGMPDKTAWTMASESMRQRQYRAENAEKRKRNSLD